MIQISTSNSVELKVFEGATKSMNDWIKAALHGRNPQKFSTFWNQYAGAKQLITDRIQTERENGMVDATTQTEECINPEFHSSVSLGDPEYEWEQYSKAFGATEVDRVLIEAQIRVRLWTVVYVNSQKLMSQRLTRSRLRGICAWSWIRRPTRSSVCKNSKRE